MTAKINLSVIIPVYNEEGIITSSTEDLVKALDEYGWNYELILAENGSKDVKGANINKISKEFVSPSIKNYGQGSLIKKNCLDVYEMKLNIVEAAFETAESIASLGAIVSIK